VSIDIAVIGARLPLNYGFSGHQSAQIDDQTTSDRAPSAYTLEQALGLSDEVYTVSIKTV
jgi:hypothetical protein